MPSIIYIPLCTQNTMYFRTVCETLSAWERLTLCLTDMNTIITRKREKVVGVSENRERFIMTSPSIIKVNII